MDELIAEENRHLKKAVSAARHGPSAVAQEAVEHAKDQVHRAVTISQYEQILDAALRDLAPDAFFAEILARIRTMLAADAATVYVLDEGGQALIVRASSGLDEAVRQNVRISVGQGVAGKVLESRLTRILDPVTDIEGAHPMLLAAGIRSLVAVPIVVGKGPIGVLEVGWKVREEVDAQEVRLLEVVADRVAVAMERQKDAPAGSDHQSQTHLVQPLLDEETALLTALQEPMRLQDSAAMLRLVRRHAEAQAKAATTIGDYEAIRDAALGSLPMDERLALLLEGTRTLLASDVAAILLMDEEGQRLWPRASIGFQTSLGVKPVAVTGSVRRIVTTGEAIRVGMVQPDDGFRVGLAEEGIQSLVAVPLRSAAHVQGVLICGHRSQDRFTQHDLELLQLVADRMQVGLERRRALEGQARQTREAEKASQFKTDLFNMATHDIKTPLSALKLQLHLLLRVEQTEAERKKVLGRMTRSVDRLAVMLDDFLDLARVEAGRMVVRPATWSVRAALLEAIEPFEAQAADHGLELEVTGADGLQAVGDPRRIAQVLTNLVSNAIRYSLNGGKVTVGAIQVAGRVEFHVRDHGLGLTSDQIARLFKPFAQVHGIPQEAEGTGLGLYLGQSIVQAHGSHLRLESGGPNQGTTASFTLPMPNGPPAQAPASAAPKRRRTRAASS